MDQLTQEQAEKLAAHIRESVAKEVAAKVATNSQRLHDMSQQYAQVGSTLSQMGVNINAAEAQAKADMMDAAKKLVMNRYAGHGYFFPTAVGLRTSIRYGTARSRRPRSTAQPGWTRTTPQCGSTKCSPTVHRFPR